VFSLEEPVSGGRLVERGSQRNAIGIRFANEPTMHGENKTVIVKAVLIYKEEERELLDIRGSWVNSDSFEADGIRHKLIAGIVTNIGFVAIEPGDRKQHIRTRAHVLKEFTSGTLFVRLTNLFTAKIIYEGHFAITTDPLSIVPTHLHY
jgi:hypothetical protein